MTAFGYSACVRIQPEYVSKHESKQILYMIIVKFIFVITGGCDDFSDSEKFRLTT